MGRIVVGVDGSAGSKRALSWAAAEAKAVLHVLMVWDDRSAARAPCGVGNPSTAHVDVPLV